MVRALDDGGFAFENRSIHTLSAALAALEEGLAERFTGRATVVQSSPPPVQKPQRRLPHDA